MGVYFFYGEEDFNIDLELNKMRSKLNHDFLSMCYKVLENPDYEDLMTALRSAPMMFGSSLTVIDMFNYFFSDENNFDDKQIQDIQNALENNQDSIDIVFLVRVSKSDGKKIDTRRKLFKVLSKFNTKEFAPFPSYKTDEISNWIKNRAKDKDIKINNDAISILIEYIGTNLMQFDKELDKLRLVAYPDKTITKEMVEKNCITNQDLFNITKFLIKGQNDKAVLEFKQLLDKKHPLEIISALQTMIKQYIIVKSKSSIQEITKLTGIKSDYRIKILKEELKNTQLKDLVKLKENLFDVEYRIKSGQILDMESEVEIALIK